MRKASSKNFGKLFSEAKKHVAAGYNSPFRSFNLVGGYPIFMKFAKGSKIIDVNNKEYIDYSLAWGPLILGHANKSIAHTIQRVALQGWCLGTPTEYETEFCKRIKMFFPSMETIRLTNSGTEAVMGAIRLARGFTKKEKIIMFKGGYHGHSNDTLVKSKNKLLSTGVPKNILTTTFVTEYNSIKSVEKILGKNKIAAILIEPIPTNMGLIIPKKKFLQNLRNICNKHNCLLIFDEVVSGFRTSKGGAQQFYNVAPDITILGKSLAGGLPVGAFGASKKIMSALSPDGQVYTAGTFSGNPLTTLCGIAALNELSNKNKYQKMIANTRLLCDDLIQFVKTNKLPVIITHIGAMFCLFFTEQKELINQADVARCDFKTFAEYFHYLLEKGIYISPSGEDTCFLSTAHSRKDIIYTAKVIKEFLKKKYIQ